VGLLVPSLGMRTVLEIGNELFQLPPQAFVTARDGYVAEARNAGERATAAELAALRRPSPSAWLVNLLALRRPDAVAQVITLGDTIRAAQGGATPTQIRDLSAQRRREISALLAEATALAVEAGEPAPSKQHLAEVESTLSAAMADEESARLVSSGRVLKTLTYSGFGQLASSGDRGGGSGVTVGPSRSAAGRGRTAAGPGRAAAEAAAGSGGTTEPAATTTAEADREARHAAAQARLDETQAALTDASRAEQVAAERVRQLTAELVELQDRLDAAQRDARTTRQARVAAERDVASAMRRLAATHGRS